MTARLCPGEAIGGRGAIVRRVSLGPVADRWQRSQFGRASASAHHVGHMAHQLWPPEDEPFLSVDEILRRWRDAFAYVSVDPAAGRARMDEVIAYIARMVGSPH